MQTITFGAFDRKHSRRVKRGLRLKGAGKGARHGYGLLRGLNE